MQRPKAYSLKVTTRPQRSFVPHIPRRSASNRRVFSARTAKPDISVNEAFTIKSESCWICVMSLRFKPQTFYDFSV